MSASDTQLKSEALVLGKNVQKSKLPHYFNKNNENKNI